MTTKLFQKQQFVLILSIVAAVALVFCLTAFVGWSNSNFSGTLVVEWKAEFTAVSLDDASDDTAAQMQINALVAEGWEFVQHQGGACLP